MDAPSAGIRGVSTAKAVGLRGVGRGRTADRSA